MQTLKLSGRWRLATTMLANIGVITLALVGAFLLRFDLSIPEPTRQNLYAVLVPSIIIHYAAFRAFTLTRGWWRYVGVTDFVNAVKAAVAGALGLAAFVGLFVRHSGFPRSVIVLNAVLIIGLGVGLRIVVRLWRQLPAERELGTR